MKNNEEPSADLQISSKNFQQEQELQGQEERDILIGVINRFIGMFSRHLQKTTMLETSQEYPFIAMNTWHVFEELLLVCQHLRKTHKCQDMRGFSFVDIGCGFGNVMLMAEQFGFDVYGIERDKPSIELAREFFDEDRIIVDDLRTFTEYDRFDVIYYFCPLTDGEREFELKVEDEMRVGSLLIANYKRSKEILRDRRFKRLSQTLPVWEKTER